MKLKLTHQQAVSLFKMLHEALLTPAVTPEYKLLAIHSRNIFKRIRNRLEEEQPKKHCNINISDAEALAYWIYFKNADLIGYDYERNFITQHVTAIAEHFGNSTYKILNP